jgi:CBS domain-containing protein
MKLVTKENPNLEPRILKTLRKRHARALHASEIRGRIGVDRTHHEEVLLLLTQTSLVAAGRVDLHRRLGVLGAGLAVVMVVLGTMGALMAASRPTGFIDVPVPPLQVLAIPFADLALFVAFVSLAFANRRRSQHHKRLMLLATIALAEAGVARWPFAFMNTALPISGIMRTKLITTRPDAPAADVVDLLRIKHVGCVPVLDDAGRPIGIITKLDVLETLGENRRTARELMMPFARGIEATGTIAEAASIMRAERIHHVLVVDDNRTLVGLVSSLDLADWIAKQGS